MKKRKVAIVIFFDKNLNIFVQERGSHSKLGEKYGFWGGGIEEGETPEEALKREILEELSFEIKDYKYWGPYSFRIDLPDSEYHREVRYGELFLAPITEDLLNSKIEEGSKKAMVHFDHALNNLNRDFGPTELKFLRKVKSDIVKFLANTSDN